MTSYVYAAWMRDVCLYVGVTGNVKKRMAAHRSRSGWPLGMTRLDVTPFPSRTEAEAFEATEIARLLPANNVRGMPRVTAA